MEKLGNGIWEFCVSMRKSSSAKFHCRAQWIEKREIFPCLNPMNLKTIRWTRWKILSFLSWLQVKKNFSMDPHRACSPSIHLTREKNGSQLTLKDCMIMVCFLPYSFFNLDIPGMTPVSPWMTPVSPERY